MVKNIYLTGFMGTGKTTAGKILSRRLGWDFVDLDDLIEQASAKKITEIFRDYGEAKFRELEKQALVRSFKRSKSVIACGGGIVLDTDNISLINTRGIGICLFASVDTVYERVKKFTHRPLLNVNNPKQRIKELMAVRRPYYEKIKYHIITDAKSPEDVAKEIIACLKNRDSDHFS